MPQTDAAASWPNYCEDDFVMKDYGFASGELLPELRLHYRTMGVPRRNAAGKIVNGVLLLQGNTGTGANWLRPSLADELYEKLVDYYNDDPNVKVIIDRRKGDRRGSTARDTEDSGNRQVRDRRRPRVPGEFPPTDVG